MTTAAVIIIGDEILTGKFADENGPFAIRRLRELGISLMRMVTIRDDIPTIAAEVRQATARYDWVFTSGGVGPTHDDLTLEGVAVGLGEELVEHPGLVQLLDTFGIDKTEGAMRMTRVPASTELIHAGPKGYPVLLAGKVVILPGIPRLFRRKFEQIAPRMAGEALATARLYTDEVETAIAARLGKADTDFPSVNIGSYPRFGEGAHQVLVTLESTDPAALEAATRWLAAQLSLTAPIEWGGAARL